MAKNDEMHRKMSKENNFKEEENTRSCSYRDLDNIQYIYIFGNCLYYL